MLCCALVRRQTDCGKQKLIGLEAETRLIKEQKVNSSQQRFFDMLIDTMMANAEEGQMEDAAALLMHAARVAEVVLPGQQK